MSNTSTIQSFVDNCRIEYLDLLKGFAILWIVWYHQPHPSFVDHYYHVPLFFFISGIFFKHKELKYFYKGITLRILISFLFFYTVSYLFQIARFLFENSTISAFEWSQFFDVLKIESKTDYLSVNIPLWFLISLFVVQILYYYISKLPKYIILLLCIIILLLKEPLLTTRSPFMINQSIYWLTYFAIGDILGKWFVYNQESIKWRLIAALTCLAFFSAISFFINNMINRHFLYNSCYEMMVFSFIFFAILVFSFIKWHSIIVNILKFYGCNSLIVLGLHLLISILFGGIAYRMFGLTNNLYIGFGNFVLTLITLYPIILFCNKYLPFCVGVSRRDNYEKDAKPPKNAK